MFYKTAVSVFLSFFLAEEEVHTETSGASNNDKGVFQSEGEVPGRRQRKRKSYGKEFQLEDSDKGLDATDAKGDGIYTFFSLI